MSQHPQKPENATRRIRFKNRIRICCISMLFLLINGLFATSSIGQNSFAVQSESLQLKKTQAPAQIPHRTAVHSQAQLQIETPALMQSQAMPVNQAVYQTSEVSGQQVIAPRAHSLSQNPIETSIEDPVINTEQQIGTWNTDALTSRKSVRSTIQFLMSIGIFSLAPALILMSTSFVRIVIVLGILRQALGMQQLPPTQVIMTLSLFMTLLIMAPVYTEVKNEAIDPYTAEGSTLDWDTAWERGAKPIKRFMSQQIDAANNSDDIWMFYEYLPEQERAETPETYDDVPLKVMLPAFLISELKIAFIIGVQLYLPFLILDVVVSSVTVSMGMMMLPPTVVSLPFKLLLFVMVDGWTLVVGMLLESFSHYT